MTAIYTITSELHDEKTVGAATQAFLESLNIDYVMQGADFSTFGQHALDLIYVRTGGTEGIFKRLLPQLQTQTQRPLRLLTSGKSNSLAASMEILSYLRHQGLRGEIIHGDPDYIRRRVQLLEQAGEALLRLRGCRLGIVGAPSDWLIASDADREAVSRKLGIELTDIAMEELLEDERLKIEDERLCGLSGAEAIYHALKAIVGRHGLQGFTIRCFDLLTAVKNTGCLALAKLNSEGTVAGCEGDVPALLSMTIVKALTGVSGFQANPAKINPQTGEMVFAHCTIPLNMVESYELDTHFESGIGVGIRGYMKTGPVTIFKVSGDLQRCFVAEGELVRNEAKPDLCRTQQVIRLNDAAQAAYFLTQPIGNHHIVVPGHHAETLKAIMEE